MTWALFAIDHDLLLQWSRIILLIPTCVTWALFAIDHDLLLQWSRIILLIPTCVTWALFAIDHDLLLQWSRIILLIPACDMGPVCNRPWPFAAVVHNHITDTNVCDMGPVNLQRTMIFSCSGPESYCCYQGVTCAMFPIATLKKIRYFNTQSLTWHFDSTCIRKHIMG